MPNLNPTPPLPGTKNTGDQLTAAEVNQLSTQAAKVAAALGAVDDGAAQTVAAALTANAAAGVPRGLLSARPTAAAAGSGALYFATDTDNLAASNGSTWRTISPRSDTQRWLDAKGLQSVLGSPSFVTNIGSGQAWPAWSMDQTALEAVQQSVFLPADWATYDVDLYWCNVSATTGNVVWRLDYLSAGQGDLVSDGVTNAAAVTAAAGLQHIMQVTTLATAVAAVSDEPTWLRVLRVASDGADTLANDAAILGMRLRKVS